MMRIRWVAIVLGFGLAVGVAGAQAGGVVVVNNTPSSRTTKSAKRDQGVVAPVPPQLVTAKKVFLSNGGSDAGLFPHPFTGTQDRAYGYLYDAIDASDRFALVATPSEADMVFELQLNAPLGPQGENKQKGTGDPLPTFKLIAYDRATHYALWTVTQTIDPANLQKTHDKNFDAALDLVLKQMMTAASPPAAATPATPAK